MISPVHGVRVPFQTVFDVTITTIRELSIPEIRLSVVEAVKIPASKEVGNIAQICLCFDSNALDNTARRVLHVTHRKLDRAAIEQLNPILTLLFVAYQAENISPLCGIQDVGDRIGPSTQSEWIFTQVSAVFGS